MKKQVFVLFFLCFGFVGFAQKETVHKIKGKIDLITVFLQGAEISQSENVNLQTGRNLLIIEGLSPQINTSSIRLSTGDETISVLAISTESNYLIKTNEKPVIKELKDSILLVTNKLQEIIDESQAIQIQKSMLMKNLSIGGNNSGVNINDLKLGADYYLQKMKEINKQLTSYSKDSTKFSEKLTILNNQLYEVTNRSGISRTNVHILLNTEKSVTTNVDLKYLVEYCGWTPSYDIRSTDIDKPIDLIYRAQVYNNTAIDWENVKMTLSLADPNQSATQPIIKPWYLNFTSYNTYSNLDYQAKGRASNEMYNQNVQQSMSNIASADGEMGFATITTNPGSNQIEVPELSAEFVIEQKYTIPADDKPYLVDIKKHTLPATYKYFAVPKLDKDAFLLARITGWEDLNLVDGEANIYFSGSYIGKSYIYTRNVKDTLDISLGRDKKVMITRTKLNTFQSTKYIGSKQLTNIAWQTVIKNNRKFPIQIEIKDQLPVSQNEDIKVERNELSDGKVDETTGEVKWSFKIDQGGTQTIKLDFTIQNPANKSVQIESIQKKSMKMYK